MCPYHNLFLESIHQKKHLLLTFDSYEKGVILRKCISFDYGPSKRYKDGEDRYHFYDLDSPDGKHNLSILPAQVLQLELLDSFFDPAEYVKWSPSWYIIRDWVIYS